MKKIALITYQSKARNAEHYNLHQRFLAIVTEEFATKYNVAPLRVKYQELFAKEDKVYLYNKAFEDTEALTKKDAERDNRQRYFNLTLQSKTFSPDADEAETARKLMFVVKPFLDAAGKPDAENTALLDNMIKKLQSEEVAGWVQTLGLTQTVADLQRLNTEYAELYSHRAEEKRVRTITESLGQLRPQVDKAAEVMFEAISALYLVNALTEKDATKEAEIGAVIDAVNAEIVQFSETLSRRGAGAKIDPDDDSPLIPDTPKEPEGGGEDDRPVIE